MFTGIIEELGRVESLQSRPAGARLEMGCHQVLSDLQQGASVAVNGACLTAVDIRSNSFSADIAPETLRLTNLGDLRAGSLVNLERALSPSGRLGGHLVQGHIDGTGEFLALEPLGEGDWWLKVRIPRELDRYIVLKGSLAIDGISLTVAELDGDVLSVAIIPHTYRSTALHTRRPGDRMNLECDILAKYVGKLLGPWRASAPRLTLENLRELGY
jgi:riboflavin synthase